MKRLLIYLMLVVILFVGVTSVSMPVNRVVIPKTALQTQKESLPNTPPCSFSATDLIISLGMRNEQSRLTNLFQSISFRLLPSFTNTFRIYYSTQVDLQQFVTGRTFFLLQSAFAQLNGYYLYHLRKLLI